MHHTDDFNFYVCHPRHAHSTKLINTKKNYLLSMKAQPMCQNKESAAFLFSTRVHHVFVSKTFMSRHVTLSVSVIQIESIPIFWPIINYSFLIMIRMLGVCSLQILLANIKLTCLGIHLCYNTFIFDAHFKEFTS